MNKIVYVGMSADILHKGHINLLNEANKYGKVVVGLLSDEAIESYKRKPIINYENRYSIIKNLTLVDKIIQQTSKYWEDNIRIIKPDFVIHGTDWKTGVMNDIRENVISTLSDIGGKLIEVPYTKGISTTQIIDKIRNKRQENMTVDYKKKLGSLIQNTLTDIKRTPECVSKELNINIDTLHNAIRGNVNIYILDHIIDMIYYTYPIAYKDIYLEVDDTNKGVVYYSKNKSLASKRITKRKNKKNIETNYYEYRDTALSRHSPIKPEWIKMLRSVDNVSPYNKDVAFNKGHLLTQCTFFIGNVNFYYEINNVKYCAQMKTGDSNFITPYVPHSFTKNINDTEESLIIAVTFSNRVRTNMNDLLFTDIHEINNIAGNIQNKQELFLKILFRQMELKNISKDILGKKLLLSNISESDIQLLFEKGICSNTMYNNIINILNILPHELKTYEFNNNDKVNIVKNQTDWIFYTNNLYYKPLANSKFFSDFSGSNNKIIAKTKVLKSSYHQYIYVYKNTLTIQWNNTNQIIQNGESIYIKPFTEYILNIIDEECLFICVKLCGELTSEYLNEFAIFNVNGRNRISNETNKWW